MRLRHLAACAGLVLVAGCGSPDTTETAAPERPLPTATTTQPAGPSGGRVAVDPDPQFVSYRRPEGGTAGGGAALVAGTLAVRDGCVVLDPGGQVVAFDADHATFDGTTLVLTPVAPGDPTVRVRVGQALRFGGGYVDYAAALRDPRTAVPRACATLAPTEVAYVEDWRPLS